MKENLEINFMIFIFSSQNKLFLGENLKKKFIFFNLISLNKIEKYNLKFFFNF